MSTYSTARAVVSVCRMQQLTEAKDTDDDWTGLTDAAARRKRQTRLNMRAHRRRKALQAASKNTPEGTIPCWDEQRQAVSYLPESEARALSFKLPMLGRHCPKIMFPLSSDHLITLIQINVMRAVMTNKQLLSTLEPSIASFDCTHGALRAFPMMASIKELPPSLYPTITQSNTPHGQWIDIFPHPTWRDNFIQAEGTFDEFDLCSDILGGLFQGEPAAECESRGIVVWSPPWDFHGWELSEGFLKKWGWSIKGCDDVLEVTNKWRSLRGEKPLEFEC